MFKNELRAFVDSNPKLVSMKPAGDGIYVLKYKKNVFFNDLWNEYLEECRGTIVDADYNVVSRPFTKIYNYGVESRAPVFSELDTVVTAFRKVNGFMVSLTWHNNDILVSTTGSTDSEFVGMAKEMMLSHMCWADWQIMLSRDDCRDLTFMFECVHPNDPHIVPENPGMYILGYREKTWESKVEYHPDMLEQLGEIFNCFVPECHHLTVAALKGVAKDARHEGFVFYDENGVGAKIKTKYYLVQKALARKKDILSLNKELVDEEYYPLVNHLISIRDQFNALDEQARLEYMRRYLEAA